MKATKSLLIAIAAAGLSVAAPAYAQHERLAHAQKAYAAVDYEATRRLAKEALEIGGNDLASTAELYLLWATAAAALERADEARTAFAFALATNPKLKLDRSLSPKIRGPYLEARGTASNSDGKAPLDLAIRRLNHDLELILRDRLSVASSVELSSRSSEQQAFAVRRFPAAPNRRVELPDISELHFYLRVLDGHANVLFELASPEEPRRLPLARARAQSLPSLPSREGESPLPYYVTAGGLAALGLAAGGLATAMFLRREDAARDWNGPSCERAGFTRQEQCGAIDERRQNAELLTIGFAATGGALLLGSAVSLLLAPSRKQPSVDLDAGPSKVMLRLRTSL